MIYSSFKTRVFITLRIKIIVKLKLIIHVTKLNDVTD